MQRGWRLGRDPTVALGLGRQTLPRRSGAGTALLAAACDLSAASPPWAHFTAAAPRRCPPSTGVFLFLRPSLPRKSAPVRPYDKLRPLLDTARDSDPVWRPLGVTLIIPFGARTLIRRAHPKDPAGPHTSMRAQLHIESHAQSALGCLSGLQARPLSGRDDTELRRRHLLARSDPASSPILHAFSSRR